jgi:putative Holliday junction resolvase
LPRPLTTVHRGDSFYEELRKIVHSEAAGEVVVGIPRGLDGQSTGQTEATERFISELRHEVDILIHLQDEALTSQKAEAELKMRGSTYAKGDVDALAASYILEDFLAGYNITEAKRDA